MPWIKVTRWWNNLNLRQRILSFSGVALGVAVLIFLKIHMAAPYVNLYENRLSADDLSEVSIALTQSHIPSKTVNNQILVPESRRIEALAALINQGIPSHPFPWISSLPAEDVDSDGAQHIHLERELASILRQVNEIADANVKLYIPLENQFFFGDEQDEAKAAVVVKLKSGYDKLPLEKVRAIVNFVSSSVPHLKPENIELTDTNGQLLNRRAEDSQDEARSTGRTLTRSKSRKTSGRIFPTSPMRLATSP